MKHPSALSLCIQAARLGSAVVLLALPRFLPAQTPSVVPVGPAGSYASFPDPSEDSQGHDVSAMLTGQPYIDPSAAGLPVPTNKWWTDLIISQYCGDLWARPLTVSANGTGIKISHPATWNATGTAMDLGTPLEVLGDVTPSLDSSDIVMADFEGGAYPAGWTTTGTAFGSAPAAGTLTGQSVVSSYYGAGLANSFNGGDASTGSLVSPAFAVDRHYITFLVGGGSQPGVAEVRLVIGGATVLSATGDNSENLHWVTWDVSAYAGQSARIEIVDNATGGWGHILADQIIRTDSTADPSLRFNPLFSPASADALRWGDWSVAFRLRQSGTQYMDVSLARGVPYVWIETSNVQPRLKTGAGAQFYNADGSTLAFPVTTDRFAIVLDGKTFGVHAPAGSQFDFDGDTVTMTLSAAHLVISALPSVSYLDTFQTYAFAVPRDSRVSWSYSPAAGKVTTDWTLDTVPLEGSNLDTIQGWLPHHYRDTSNNLAFQPGLTYATPRGLLQCAIGHTGWQIQYPFEGIAPVLPLPRALGKTHDYDPAILKKYLDNYATVDTYGTDTYWGGKSLTQLGDYIFMARLDGLTADYDALKSTLYSALTDWFTYTPGETECYFARYDNWKALIGFNDSYGSYQFTDNHFHYGYFTLSAALLAFQDPEFATDYGPMATQVAKQYANWDRNDTAYPFLRTFDPWEGHSYAGGFSSPGGNNQESSSEAIQSWAGIFMLGSALNNTAMRDAGAMGYAMERASVREYWLDVHRDILPASYGHSTTGILFDSGQAYATYFSGDPAWMYGIQWLPASTHLAYLGWDPAFAKARLADMFADRPLTLAPGVAGDNRFNLNQAYLSWYGVGGNALDQNAGINSIKAAINNAYLQNPSYVTAADASNPLYDTTAGALCVTVNADGTLGYPGTYWTPSTLPASLVPPAPDPANPAAEPTAWNLWQYLGINYTPDTACMADLYSYDVTGYTSADASHAADVYSRMGDALGNVVLGYVAQYDPDFYADVHSELWSRNDPAVTGNSMAGIVYYTAYSNRGLGTPVTDRHTDMPTSQAYKDSAGTYHYVVYNPASIQQTATVYDDSGNTIGAFPVPAGALLDHKLDQTLTSLVITASNTARTLQPGQTDQFTVIGYDQYGATFPLGAVTWTVSAGGSIDTSGLFTATDDADPVVVTATTGGRSQSYSFRVGDAPVLSRIAVSPAFQRLAVGGSAAFTAAGLDQYGDPCALDAVTWTTSAPGDTIDATGSFTGSATGVGYVTATSGGFTGSAVVSVQAAQANIAQGKTITASTENGANTAADAVDGNTATRWESTQGLDDQWITMDLGARYDLSRVYIDWEPAYAATYRIEVSDSTDGPWQDIKDVAKSSASADDLAVSGAGRFVRLHCLIRATGYGFSLYELEVYGWLRGDSATPATVLVSPADATVATGQTIAYQAYAFDAASQGGPIDATSWTVSGGGAIDASGAFTAATVGGPYTVTATDGAVSGSTGITVTSGSSSSGDYVDLALGKTATASSEENEAFPASAAIDGNTGTRWSSEASDGQYLDVDLGASMTIRRFDLSWETASASAYRIQVRNATTEDWNTVVTVSSGTGGDETHSVNVTARYVRLQCDTRATQWGVSLWEFGIYGPAPAGANLAFDRPVVASSVENTGTSADNATDGNTATRWSSDYADDEWIYVDLGSPKTVSSVTLVWETAYASSYIIEGSDDPNGTWTQLAAKSDGAGGTETLPVSGTCRYIRMHGLSRATPWGYSLWKFEVR